MEFWIALFGTVVGGAISLATTFYFQLRHELKTKKSLASSLIFRVMGASEDLHKIHEHILKSVSDGNGNFIEKDKYFESTQQILGGSDVLLDYCALELSLLHRNEDNELVMEIIKVIRARNIAVKLIARYNEMKRDLDETLPSVGEFIMQNGVRRLRLDISRAENPELMGKIYMGNDLVAGLLELTTGAYGDARKTGDELAKALPKYFPKCTQLKSFSLPK